MVKLASANELSSLLRRAHQRSFWITLSVQMIYGLGIVCLGGCLLLLLGTQVLHPFWLITLGAAVLGIVAYRVRHRMVAPYRLAQLIDASCGFHDAVSTAIHFEQPAAAEKIPEARRLFQHQHATELAAHVNLAQVFPFRLPRAAYASVALLAVAIGLFAYRYGVAHKLDLQQPLIAFHIDAFTQQEKQVAQEQKNIRQQLQDQLKQMGVNLTPMDGNEAVDPNDPHPFQSLSTTESANNEATTPGQENSRQSDRQGNPGASNEQVPGDKNESAKGNPAPSDEKGDSAGKDGDKQNQQNASAQQGNQQNAGNSNKSPNDSNLLSKLRDNIANMMNKLKSPSQDGDQQQQGQSKPNQQAAGNQGQKANSSPSRNSNQQNSQGEQQQADQQGEGGDKTQSAASKQGDKSSQQPSSDSKSGVGKQDGDKDVRAAEQLAAMGKLSELLGKRSQSIAGEITVETPSGNQQLITPYSKRRVAHGEAGGESNRDEIPLAYQHYVQQYFEQIHRSSGKKSDGGVQKP